MLTVLDPILMFRNDCSTVSVMEQAVGALTDKHSRMMTDVNGVGKADVVGFGNKGVFVSFTDESSQERHSKPTCLILPTTKRVPSSFFHDPTHLARFHTKWCGCEASGFSADSSYDYSPLPTEEAKVYLQ